MGLVQTSIILISACIRVFLRLKAEQRVKIMAEYYRDGHWQADISSTDLVPGDIFQIEEGSQVPCDAVILSGTVVVNESGLTGEAMPIRKFCFPDDDGLYEMEGTRQSNTIFAGTFVSQRVYGLVLRTVIATEKGKLVRKILFPSSVSFIFDEHIKMAICILLLWGGITFGFTLYLMGRAFTINQSVCAARLRKKQITCIDLTRINLAGKVNIFCFDKTGTLTREGLEFFGSWYKGERVQEPLKMDPVLAMGIATCHAVTKVGEEFIGNPVDIESFHAMHWEPVPSCCLDYLDSFMPPNPDLKPVHVIIRCEFVHAFASQSVAVLDSGSQDVHVFLKGSFEKVKSVSSEASLPVDYDTVASGYAQQGCYVLALAHKNLGELDKDITIADVKQMSRETLEDGCEFVGFILFRNMLKDDTKEAISQLKQGDVRTVMVTGDTALTGISIATQCKMIEPGKKVILGDLIQQENHQQIIVWREVVENGGQQQEVREIDIDSKTTELAMTGQAFEYLVFHNRIDEYLLFTRVFARMTPSHKVTCVQLHMEKGVTGYAEASMVSPFSTGNRTIMQCVELLKQGRAALATSFANYRFLIFYGEIMCAWELTMFYFSVIAPQSIWITIDGFITISMTFAITQAKPGNRLSPARPTAKPLGIYTLASCCGVIFINFLFAMTSIIWLFQQDWFICNEFDSTSIDTAKWWLLGDNYESEIIILVVLFQFFNSAAIVNFGTSFRQSWWRNYVLVFLILADPNPYSCMFRINCGSRDTLVALGYPEPSWEIPVYNSPVGHNVLPKYFRWELWAFVMGNCLANILWERVILLWVVKSWVSKRREKYIKELL
ncbi:E1-E2 ATPase-domain-containing protein [Pilaira anomala]|nr:E1-E2 ATPase-domain-containing protein [Pilaira anomala]